MGGNDIDDTNDDDDDDITSNWDPTVDQTQYNELNIH